MIKIVIIPGNPRKPIIIAVIKFIGISMPIPSPKKFIASKMINPIELLITSFQIIFNGALKSFPKKTTAKKPQA